MSAPNPGSDAARALGCCCAVLDNNRGRFAPWPATDTEPEGWWISEPCTVHGLAAAPTGVEGEAR